jgi:hypothetical protein
MPESGYYVLLLKLLWLTEAAPGLLSWGGETFEGVVVSLLFHECFLVQICGFVACRQNGTDSAMYKL